ncbi:hypothetical protein DPX39_100137100 [Trypanosoma brucei equiperdum]|uniref:Uncharacterized protein n=1 Tax=Trypanosoma brucei equiperdum TaxID=630700 RepID=A0A3L6KXK5_9TRYP|nr:hypothetical protein DPX39_100137100 [Trypanosoma brucei equiperdum]
MKDDELERKIEAAQQKLAALKQREEDMEVEQRQKESLLSQLKDQINDLDRKKGMILERVKEVNAETDAVRSYLHSIEHLDMLEGMLFERKTQLLHQQRRRDMLLQQLSDVETALGKSRTQSDEELNNDTECDCTPSVEEWENINLLRRNANGIYRFFRSSMSHALDHPATVFHQSIRKMSRMARDREVELAMQVECIETYTQQMVLQERTLSRIEHEYKQEVGSMQRSGRSMLQAMGEAAEAEVAELRIAIQRALEERSELQSRLRRHNKTSQNNGLLLNGNLLIAENRHSDPLEGEKKCGDEKGDGTSVRVEADTEKQELASPRLVNGEEILNPVETNATRTTDPARFTGEYLPRVSNDPELDGLRRQVATMERYALRMHRRYEELEEDVAKRLKEHDINVKRQETKLKEATNAVTVLEKEKLEWKALKKQMSLLAH